MEAATVGRRAAAPARAPSTRPARRPARKTAPRTAPGRGARGQLIPIAVGTAAAVRQLPDSGLIVRLTRGRAWIGLLGLLLAGIVALNVFTLSLAATAGSVDQNIQALEKENGLLRSRDAHLSGVGLVSEQAGTLGLRMASIDDVNMIEAGRHDLATAVGRLAAAGSGY